MWGDLKHEIKFQLIQTSQHPSPTMRRRLWLGPVSVAEGRKIGTRGGAHDKMSANAHRANAVVSLVNISELGELGQEYGNKRQSSRRSHHPWVCTAGAEIVTTPNTHFYLLLERACYPCSECQIEVWKIDPRCQLEWVIDATGTCCEWQIQRRQWIVVFQKCSVNHWDYSSLADLSISGLMRA